MLENLQKKLALQVKILSTQHHLKDLNKVKHGRESLLSTNRLYLRNKHCYRKTLKNLLKKLARQV